MKSIDKCRYRSATRKLARVVQSNTYEVHSRIEVSAGLLIVLLSSDFLKQ